MIPVWVDGKAAWKAKCQHSSAQWGREGADGYCTGILDIQPKSSTFCMLDEVDAPLDDANVGRFCEMVKEMSRTVQFIYITHNKVTMEMAEQLMGVTMHEAGVSRMVTVDVDEAVALSAV